MNGKMGQMREENADALGMEIAIPKASSSFNGDITQQVWDQLKTCYDPEIPVNIYELGLIYDVKVNESKANIIMTLTSPNCPVAESLPQEVKDSAMQVEGIEEVDLDLVFEPPWEKSMMSESAKLELNL